MKNISNNIAPIDRELEYLLELLKHGSISKAADFLDMDQGNLSRVLSRLEKKLGEKLFHRHQRGLVATERAKSMAATITQMQELWKVNFKNDTISSKIQGNLKIGFHPSVGQTYLPHLLQPLQDLVQASLEFSFGGSVEMTQKVMNRQLDLAIAINPIKSKDLIVRSIGTETIDLVGLGALDHQNKKSLLLNPEMLFQGKIIRGLKVLNVIQISNYEIIAEACQKNSNFMGVVPSGITKRHPGLKVLRSLRNEVNVKLVTFPGSKISKHLPDLAKLVT